MSDTAKLIAQARAIPRVRTPNLLAMLADALEAAEAERDEAQQGVEYAIACMAEWQERAERLTAFYENAVITVPALEAENARLREALKRIADGAESNPADEVASVARAALAGSGDE